MLVGQAANTLRLSVLPGGVLVSCGGNGINEDGDNDNAPDYGKYYHPFPVPTHRHILDAGNLSVFNCAGFSDLLYLQRELRVCDGEDDAGDIGVVGKADADRLTDSPGLDLRLYGFRRESPGSGIGGSGNGQGGYQEKC